MARRTWPDAIWCVKSALRCASVDATVRLVPIGLLISCATPATRPPSAASLSVSMRYRCVSLACRAASANLLLSRISANSAARTDRHKQDAELGRRDALGD